MFLPVKNLLPAKTLEAIWNCNRFRCWIITYKFSTSAFLFSLVCGLLRVFLSGIADPALSKVKSFKGLKTRVLAEHQSLGNELWIKSVELAEKQNFNMMEGFFCLFSFKYRFNSKEKNLFSPPRDKGICKDTASYISKGMVTFYNFQHSFTRVELLRICDLHESPNKIGNFKLHWTKLQVNFQVSFDL